MKPDEVREKENMNRLGGDLDEPRHTVESRPSR